VGIRPEKFSAYFVKDKTKGVSIPKGLVHAKFA